MIQASGVPRTSSSTRSSSSNNSWARSSNMSMHSHYRPYSVALQETPLIAPRFQNASFSNNCFPAKQYSAFLPPATCESSSKPLTTASSSSSSSCLQPSVTVPFAQKVAPNNNNSNTQGNKVDSSMASLQRENARLKDVNKDLLERVRQWETWYMTVRQDLDASNTEAQARANHWQAQAEEMQRQKAVLTARVRRWQQRWAKGIVVKKGGKSVSQHANAKKDHSRQTSTTSRDLRPLTRRSTPQKVQIPLLQNKRSEEMDEIKPRPFKKRCFGSSSTNNYHEDPSLPPTSPSLDTKTAKIPRPILKVRISSASSSSTRCSTPHEGNSTNAAPVTPSTPEGEGEGTVEG